MPAQHTAHVAPAPITANPDQARTADDATTPGTMLSTPLGLGEATIDVVSASLTVLTCVATLHRAALTLDALDRLDLRKNDARAPQDRLAKQEHLDAQALLCLVQALTTDPRRGITTATLAGPVLQELSASTLYRDVASRNGLEDVLDRLAEALATYDTVVAH